MFRHFPKRIARNVGDDDRRSSKCRRPARAGAWSNWHLLHFLPPSLGKSRPRHRIQMDAIGTKQQNRSKRAAAVLFDNHAQRIEDLLERNAGGHHLKQMLFPGEQRLAALALANVYRSTGIIFDARLPENRSTHTLDMLNRSVRERESKFDVKPASLTNRFLEASLNKRSIFRMNRFRSEERRVG